MKIEFGGCLEGNELSGRLLSTTLTVGAPFSTNELSRSCSEAGAFEQKLIKAGALTEN